jgi:hypothetical protein
MQYSGTGLGPNFQLNSAGSKHSSYLKVLNTSAASVKGKGVVIAVVDTGVEKAKIVDGFLDLVEPNNTSEKDNFGHGTAMGTIIKDVAKAAKVHAVRMSKQDPSVSEGMLGMCAGSFHYKADIINLSSSLPEGTTCSQCGAQPGVSKVPKRFLESLSEKAYIFKRETSGSRSHGQQLQKLRFCLASPLGFCTCHWIDNGSQGSL